MASRVLTAEELTFVAASCHEANRRFCIMHGDPSQPPWWGATDEIQESSKRGVLAALDGATPRELHEKWCAEKVKNGWRHGEEKCAEKKTHPCLLPYDSLPEFQKQKDELFLGVVKACAKTLNVDLRRKNGRFA